jgi:hypothetical protein
MSDADSEELDFEYHIRQGSRVYIVRYDRNHQPRFKVALNLAEVKSIHVDDFMASFKDTMSGSIFMRFETYDGYEVTSLTTQVHNVYTTFEDGEEHGCAFFDDEVDETIAFDTSDFDRIP